MYLETLNNIVMTILAIISIVWLMIIFYIFIKDVFS